MSPTRTNESDAQKCTHAVGQAYIRSKNIKFCGFGEKFQNLASMGFTGTDSHFVPILVKISEGEVTKMMHDKKSSAAILWTTGVIPLKILQDHSFLIPCTIYLPSFI